MGAAVRAPELVDALVLYETSVAWSPGWDDSVMQGVFAADDPEDSALRLMLGPAYDGMDDDERARRRLKASAFLAARIPRFELVTVPDAGHHAHRRVPEAFADLVRRGWQPAR